MDVTLVLVVLIVAAYLAWVAYLDKRPARKREERR